MVDYFYFCKRFIQYRPIVLILNVRSRLWFFLVLVFLASGAASQEWNYARLVMIYGGNIPFNFNSLKRYAEGLEISDGTILGVTLADSSQAGRILDGFELNVRAFNGATEIVGDANSLDLNVIRIKAEVSQGFELGIFDSEGYIDLPPDFEVLCSYLDNVGGFDDLVWSDHQLSISYECGKPVAAGGNGSLLGEPPDYYHVEIELELVPTGFGF
jgi:hypothetical protein